MLEDKEILNNNEGIESRTVVTKEYREEDGKFYVDITIKTFDKNGKENIVTDVREYNSQEEYERELEDN